jgi:thymidylate synthase (FAD)
MKIIKPSVSLLWITPDPELQIEAAGRTCYKSEDQITKDSAYEFAKRMRALGHHAMLEHAVASFRIVTDRGITHEIVRHRLASYAQESTRFCNYTEAKFGNQCTFIEPPEMSPEQRNEWEKACLFAEEQYFKMINAGCSPQIARSVLPNCLKTEIVMMANLREWRHFISIRATKKAHPQMRPIAYRIWEILKDYAPSTFEDINPDI